MVIHLEGETATNSGLSWAYAIPMHDGEPYTVEDEDGNVETITPRLGGELLIAKNVDVKPYSTVGEFYMEFVHDVFQYMKIKNG